MSKRDQQPELLDADGNEIAKEDEVYFEAGMRVGRYTDVTGRVKKKGKKWFLESGQEFDLSKLISDIFS